MESVPLCTRPEETMKERCSILKLFVLRGSTSRKGPAGVQRMTVKHDSALPRTCRERQRLWLGTVKALAGVLASPRCLQLHHGLTFVPTASTLPPVQ